MNTNTPNKNTPNKATPNAGSFAPVKYPVPQYLELPLISRNNITGKLQLERDQRGKAVFRPLDSNPILKGAYNNWSGAGALNDVTNTPHSPIGTSPDDWQGYLPESDEAMARDYATPGGRRYTDAIVSNFRPYVHNGQLIRGMPNKFTAPGENPYASIARSLGEYFQRGQDPDLSQEDQRSIYDLVNEASIENPGKYNSPQGQASKAAHRLSGLANWTDFALDAGDIAFDFIPGLKAIGAKFPRSRAALTWGSVLGNPVSRTMDMGASAVDTAQRYAGDNPNRPLEGEPLPSEMRARYFSPYSTWVQKGIIGPKGDRAPTARLAAAGFTRAFTAPVSGVLDRGIGTFNMWRDSKGSGAMHKAGMGVNTAAYIRHLYKLLPSITESVGTIKSGGSVLSTLRNTPVSNVAAGLMASSAGIELGNIAAEGSEQLAKIRGEAEYRDAMLGPRAGMLDMAHRGSRPAARRYTPPKNMTAFHRKVTDHLLSQGIQPGNMTRAQAYAKYINDTSVKGKSAAKLIWWGQPFIKPTKQ